MNILSVAQTLLAILLVVCILFQGRGAGLGSSFGSDGELYGTRRGIEKILFKITVLLSVIFVILSLSSFL